MNFIPFARVKLYASILLLLIIQSCTYRIDRVNIEGELHGNSKSYIYISRFEGDTLALIDSIKTNSKGRFKIRQDATNPYLITIGLNKAESPIILLVQPGEDISIRSESSDLSDYLVYGSNGSELVRELGLSLNRAKHQIDSLKMVYDASRGRTDIDSISNVLDSTYNSLIVNHRNSICSFIKDNTFSLASVLALFQSYDPLHPVFDYSKDKKLFRLVDSTLLSVYSSNSLVKAYHAKIQRLDSLNERILKREQMFKEGEVLPNVGYPLISGDNLFYSSLWFKYMLVDFKGSWCEACTQNNSALKGIYKDYSPKGLLILQVTLGGNVDSLRADVLRDSVMWYNSCVTDIYSSSMLDTLKVSSIPSSYIIDRWGVIKAANLSGEKLRSKLSELLPK